MPNNSTEPLRNKLYEEYEDSLMRLVMYEAAEKEGKTFLEETVKLKNDPAYTPSVDAVQRFNSKLDTIIKKNRASALRRRILKISNRSAIAMLIVIVLLLTTVASVQALRVRVLNFFIDIKPEYTSFQLKENGDSPSGSPVVEWTKAYVPTYIPEGYKVSSSSSSETYKKIIFQNQKGSVIIYTESNEDSMLNMDTENASVVKEISINDHKGMLAVKNSTVTIVWVLDEHVFTVQASSDEDTVVKIAEGVVFIN